MLSYVLVLLLAVSSAMQVGIDLQGSFTAVDPNQGSASQIGGQSPDGLVMGVFTYDRGNQTMFLAKYSQGTGSPSITVQNMHTKHVLYTMNLQRDVSSLEYDRQTGHLFGLATNTQTQNISLVRITTQDDWNSRGVAPGSMEVVREHLGVVGAQIGISAFDEASGRFYCLLTGKDWDDRIYALETRGDISAYALQKSDPIEDGVSFLAFDPRASALYAVVEFQGFPKPGCEGVRLSGKWLYPPGCPFYIDPNIPVNPFAPPPPPPPPHEDPHRIVVQVTEQTTGDGISFVFKRVYDSFSKSHRQKPTSSPTKPVFENAQYRAGSGEYSQLFNNLFYFEDRIMTLAYMSRDMRPRIQSVELNDADALLVADTDQAVEIMRPAVIPYTSGIVNSTATATRRQINSQFAPPVPHIDSTISPRIAQAEWLPYPAEMLNIHLVDSAAGHGYTYQVFLRAQGGFWRGPSDVPGLTYGVSDLQEGPLVAFEGSYQSVTSALNQLQISGASNAADNEMKISIAVKLKVREDSLNDVFHGFFKPVINSTNSIYHSRPFNIPSSETAHYPVNRECSLFPGAEQCRSGLGTVEVPYEIWKSKATMIQGEARDTTFGIKALNDPPKINIPPEQLIPPASVLVITGINITDTDFYEPLYNNPQYANSGLSPVNNIMNVRLTASQGIMSLDFRSEDYANLTFLEGTLRLKQQMIVIEGDLNTINLALRSIEFVPPASALAGSVIGITIRADDKGNTGFDGVAEWSTRILNVVLTCDLAAAPQVWYSQFDNSGARIRLYFDRPTDRAGMAGVQNCEGLLSEESRAKLGRSSNPSLCSWESDTVLLIQAGNGATLLPDSDLLTLDPQPSKPVKSCITSMFFATGPAVQVLYPELPPKPVTQLVGPTLIGFCENAEVDARLSTGGGGRPLTNSWSVYEPERMVNVTAALMLNAVLSRESGTVLVIDGQHLEAGTLYTIAVQARNFFGVPGDTKLFEFAVSVMPLPTVYIEGAPERVYFKPSKSNYIAAFASLSNCMDMGQAIDYKWDIHGDTHPMFWWHSVTRKTRNLWIVPGSLTVGDTYVFRITATMKSHAALTASSTVVVTVGSSELVCAIRGGDKVVGAKVPILLDGSPSNDPDVYSCADLPRNDDGEIIEGPCDIIRPDDPVLTFKWTCRMGDNELMPCISALDGINMDSHLNRTVLNTIPPGHLAANSSYQFFLEISKTGKESKSRSVILTVQEGAPPDVLIKALSSPKVNRNSKLGLEGSAISFYPVKYQWSLITGDIDFAAPGVLTTPITEPNLVVAAFALTAGQKYKFALNVIPVLADGSFGRIGQGVIEVQVNSPPSGGDLTIEPPEGLAGTTQFTLTADDWTDDPEDLPLVYIFRYMTLSGEEMAVSEPQLKSSSTCLLPSEGQTRHLKTVLVQVSDAYNGVVVFSRTAWINKPRMSVEEKLAFVQDLDAGAMQAAFDRGDIDGIMGLVDSLVDVLNDKDGGGGKFYPEIDPDESPEAYQAQQEQIAQDEAETARVNSLILGTGSKMRLKMLVNLENLGAFIEMTPTTIDKQAKAISKISAAAEEAGKDAQSKGNDQVKDLVGKTGDKGMEESTGAAAGQVLSNIIEAGKLLEGKSCGNETNSSNSSNSTSCNTQKQVLSGSVVFEGVSSSDVQDPSFQTALIQALGTMAVVSVDHVTLDVSNRRSATVTFQIEVDSEGEMTAIKDALSAPGVGAQTLVLLTAQLEVNGYTGSRVQTMDVAAGSDATTDSASAAPATDAGDPELQAFKAEQARKTDQTISSLVETIQGALKPGEASIDMAAENIQLTVQKVYPAGLNSRAYTIPALPGQAGTVFQLPGKILENAQSNNATEIVALEPGNFSNPAEVSSFAVQYSRGRRLLSNQRNQYNTGRRLLSRTAAAIAASAGSVESTGTGADGSTKDGDIEPGTGPLGMLSNISGLGLSGGGTSLQIEDLPEFITIRIPTSMESLTDSAQQTPACQYWDTNEKRWSSRGCVVSKVDLQFTTCLCSHLTDFGATLSNSGIDLSFIDPVADETSLLALDMSQVGGLIMVCACFIGYGLGCYYGGKQDKLERDTVEVLQGKIVLRPDGTYEWVEQTLAEVFISRFRADMLQKKDKELREQEDKRQSRIVAFMDEHNKEDTQALPLQGAEVQGAEKGGERSEVESFKHDNPFHDTLIRICWICLEETQPEHMIRACQCRDMLEWCHKECLKTYIETEGPSVMNPLGTEWAFTCPNCAQLYQNPESFETPLAELTDTEEDDPVKKLEEELVDFTDLDIIMLQRKMYRNAFSDKKMCFVCLEEEDLTNLVNPCGCTGHLKYAHEECFLRWHSETKLIKCPYCDQGFGFRPKKITKSLLNTESKVGEVFEGTKLNRLEIFQKVAWTNLKEMHPLLMCMFCPPGDAFTRPQRLTVLLAGVYASLLSTAFMMSMRPPESIIDQVIAGVVTVLIVIPVNITFKGIFSIGQGPKESLESPTVRENEIRETPWGRQERMLRQRRWDNASLQEKVWLSVIGKGAPAKPPDPGKVYAKADLDKYGKNVVVDICKCIAWVMAIFYLLGTGGMIVIYSFMFTPNQNTEWLGLAWLTTSQDWIVAKPIGALKAGTIAAIKGDLEETLLWVRDKLEFVVDYIKRLIKRARKSL